MTSENSVTHWIELLKAGDEQAAQVLWERYFAAIVRLAREKLRGVPRQMNDEEDIALSAFNSFFEAVNRKRFPSLNDRGDLWQVLVMHTARKAIDQRRYYGRAKRGGKQGEMAFSLQEPSVDNALQELLSKEPNPEFAAQVAEEMQVLLDKLSDSNHRTIARLKLEGYTVPEISRKLGLSERTIWRCLGLTRRLWQENMAVNDDEE